jgi:uncharacterized pyridoxamine 5'-phosphate oxidase family protein
MEYLDYMELSNEIIEKLIAEQTIILAACADDKVTARAMAHINDGLDILFATNRNSEKIKQMERNPNIALAIDNLKVEAEAELFGHPKGHSFFILEYPKKFPHLGSIYPEKPDDILVIARPKKISLFKYLGKPCEDVLDVINNCAFRKEL